MRLALPGDRGRDFEVIYILPPGRTSFPPYSSIDVIPVQVLLAIPDIAVTNLLHGALFAERIVVKLCVPDFSIISDPQKRCYCSRL